VQTPAPGAVDSRRASRSLNTASRSRSDQTASGLRPCGTKQNLGFSRIFDGGSGRLPVDQLSASLEAELHESPLQARHRWDVLIRAQVRELTRRDPAPSGGDPGNPLETDPWHV
jgi:hypothetical protein